MRIIDKYTLIILYAYKVLILTTVFITCCVISLRGSDHLNQTDVKFVLPSFAHRNLPAHTIHFGPGGIDSGVAHQVNLDICHSFLKRHLLKGLIHSTIL